MAPEKRQRSPKSKTPPPQSGEILRREIVGRIDLFQSGKMESRELARWAADTLTVTQLDGNSALVIDILTALALLERARAPHDALARRLDAMRAELEGEDDHVVVSRYVGPKRVEKLAGGSGGSRSISSTEDRGQA